MLGNKNILPQKTFLKQIDRYKTTRRFVSEEYKYFDFNNNLKSNHLKELQFTNYVSSNQCKKYYTLLDICKKISKDEKEWDKLFIADEIDIDVDIPKLNRIYNIINIVNGEEVNRKELILKFKYLDDMEIQFYVRNEDGVLTLYLIDMYHIGIEATNKNTGKTDRIGIYNSRKKCSYDIKNITNELNKNSDKP